MVECLTGTEDLNTVPAAGTDGKPMLYSIYPGCRILFPQGSDTPMLALRSLTLRGKNRKLEIENSSAV